MNNDIFPFESIYINIKICLIHIDINQHNSMQLGDLIIGSYNTSIQK